MNTKLLQQSCTAIVVKGPEQQVQFQGLEGGGGGLSLYLVKPWLRYTGDFSYIKWKQASYSKATYSIIRVTTTADKVRAVTSITASLGQPSQSKCSKQRSGCCMTVWSFEKNNEQWMNHNYFSSLYWLHINIVISILSLDWSNAITQRPRIFHLHTVITVRHTEILLHIKTVQNYIWVILFVCFYSVADRLPWDFMPLKHKEQTLFIFYLVTSIIIMYRTTAYKISRDILKCCRLYFISIFAAY